MIPSGILQDAGIFLDEENVAYRKSDSIAVNYLCNYINHNLVKDGHNCYWFEIFYIMQDKQKLYLCDPDISMTDRIRPVSMFGGVSGSLFPIINEQKLDKIGYVLCYRNGVIDENGNRRAILTNGKLVKCRTALEGCMLTDADCGYFSEMNLREFFKISESTV